MARRLPIFRDTRDISSDHQLVGSCADRTAKLGTAWREDGGALSAASAVATAVSFVWLGMVLAISFVEAPLKFQAPGVTIPIGLGIGRRVFLALNAAEIVFAAVLVIADVLGAPYVSVVVAAVTAVATLVSQLALVRPRLNRRTKAVLAGENAPRSRAHFAYVALEIVKVAALAVGGIMLLTT